MNSKEIMALPASEIFTRLKSSANGLTSGESTERLSTYGKNEIKSSETSWFRILLRQFTSPFFYLLLLAFGVSFFLGETFDALMILAFVGINATLGFFQEYRSEQTVALLSRFIASKVRVRRDGKETLVESTLLVPGDIIFIEPGDIIPVDMVILDSYDLTLNESVLTGESEPVSKGPTSPQCFSGTIVASGKGTGIVVATGKDTSYGDIARLTTQAKKESTFERELGRLSKFILILVIITLCFVVLINWWVKDTFNFVEFLLFAIALSVSVIPEALPVVTTFSLSIGARHLAKKSVVVKRLSAIEDLGSIEILCSDKTGTLTENVLEVVGTKTEDQSKLFHYASLASTYDPTSRNAGNNAFEVAISNALSKFKIKDLHSYKKVHEIPFDPERRRATALIAHGRSHIVISRGAPESIIPLCTLTKKQKEEVHAWIIERGKMGIRVLAVANKILKGPTSPKATLGATSIIDKEEKGMELVGFIAFKDPIKQSTFSALQKAKDLGVQIKILTGDSPHVAGAVAKDVGLIASIDEVITGEDFEKMSTQKQHDAIFSCHVFARVTPVQKYKIIELLKEKHEVGFLGEGINDAPALKISNVAMVVQSASDVAREASDIVLLDRSLSVIIDGIHEGRAVFANTSKYITTTLSANFGNFFAVAIVSLIIDYLPMLPLQILLVNLLSDFPMIAVATDTVDTSEVNVPRKYNLKGMAAFSLILGITSTFFDFVFFAVFKNSGAPVLQTTWFIGSVLTELVFIYSTRTKKFFLKSKLPSWSLMVLTIIAMEITVFVPYTNIGHNVFKFITPSNIQIMEVIGIVVMYFITTESVKLLYYRFTTKPLAKGKERIIL